MAILDIQIVSASLTEIQAGLSASRRRDHLGADRLPDRRGGHDPAVRLPVARARHAHAVRDLGRPASPLASLMCGLSTSIDEMIVWRALQGFIGGGMIPTVFATAYHDLPALAAGDRSRRSSAWSRRWRRPSGRPSAAISPTRCPGTGCSSSTSCPASSSRSRRSLLIDFDKPDYSLFDNFDWCGPALAWPASSARSNTCSRKARATTGSTTTRSLLFAVGLGARRRSSSSPACCTARQPIVDLRAFANRNFAIGSLFSFVLGIGLYGLTYLYPRLSRADPRLRRADDRRDACSSPGWPCS